MDSKKQRNPIRRARYHSLEHQQSIAAAEAAKERKLRHPYLYYHPSKAARLGSPSEDMEGQQPVQNRRGIQFGRGRYRSSVHQDQGGSSEVLSNNPSELYQNPGNSSENNNSTKQIPPEVTAIQGVETQTKKDSDHNPSSPTSLISSLNQISINPIMGGNNQLEPAPKAVLISPPPAEVGVKSPNGDGYSSKYYKMDEDTLRGFWSHPFSPPPKVEVFPKGHPKNRGVQTVWKATDREIGYFADKQLLLNTVPSTNVARSKDSNFYDVHSNTVFSGQFVVPGMPLAPVLHPMLPEHKMNHLEALAEKYGPTVWPRITETFGKSIAKIVMTVAGNTKNDTMSILILTGNNFQGASCIAAAKHLGALNVEVFVCSVTSKGMDEPFPCSNLIDLQYEDIRVVLDLKAIKNEVFDFVIFGVDDHKSPTTTLHVYKEWMLRAGIVLVEPPMIRKSYTYLIDKICHGKVKQVVLINAIRPTACTVLEDLQMFVVNIPTSNEYPPFGEIDYNVVKSLDPRGVKEQKQTSPRTGSGSKKEKEALNRVMDLK